MVEEGFRLMSAVISVRCQIGFFGILIFCIFVFSTTGECSPFSRTSVSTGSRGVTSNCYPVGKEYCSLTSSWDSDLGGSTTSLPLPSTNSRNKSCDSRNKSCATNSKDKYYGSYCNISRNEQPKKTPVASFSLSTKEGVQKAITVVRFQLQQMNRLYTPGISRSFYTTRNKLIRKLKQLILEEERFREE